MGVFMEESQLSLKPEVPMPTIFILVTYLPKKKKKKQHYNTLGFGTVIFSIKNSIKNALLTYN
jgi:hypothetical protein